MDSKQLQIAAPSPGSCRRPDSAGPSWVFSRPPPFRLLHLQGAQRPAKYHSPAELAVGTVIGSSFKLQPC